MGNRLSKIYTRTGDKGTTGLGDGSRISKDDIRMETIGTVDELNSHIGVLIASLQLQDKNDSLLPLLTRIQHHLFDIGGELCVPDMIAITDKKVTFLEEELDKLNDELPPLKNFILPGGNLAAAHCHTARAVCRRAERIYTTLANTHTVNEETGKYINRLSDVLFVCARVIARRNDGKEVLWEQELSKI